MTLSRWQPFRELTTIRKQMDRLFEDMLDSQDKDWLGLHSVGGMWTPAVELEETEVALILKAEIPGIDAKDLTVEVDQDRVTISGEYKKEDKVTDKEQNFFRSEFYYGEFERNVSLPMPVKTDAIKSSFKDGVLTLTMPKVTVEPKKSVKINLSDS